MSIAALVQLSPGLAIAVMVLCGLLGAVMGGLVNRLAWRIVQGQSVLSGRSRCPRCEQVLTLPDLVPVFSWVFLRGRCRHCGERIGARSVVAEVLCAGAFVSIAWVYGLTLQGVALCALCCILLGLSLTDLESFIIPNGFILAGIIVWAVAFALAALGTSGGVPTECLGSLATGVSNGNPLLAVLIDSLAGGLGVSFIMLAFSLVFDRLTGKQSLGGGDVKLFFVTGLFLGLGGNLLNMVLSCLIGALFGLVQTSRSGRGGAAGEPFPFGPAIAFSTWLCLLVGPAVVGSYLSLIF